MALLPCLSFSLQPERGDLLSTASVKRHADTLGDVFTWVRVR